MNDIVTGPEALVKRVRTQYNNDMTSAQGAVAPAQPQRGQVVQGYLEPGANSAVDAKSTTAHSFFQVLKHLVRNSGAYHSEVQVLDALDVIERYRKHALGSDHSKVVGEGDAAPVEDVSLRPPPAGAAPAPVAVGGQAIDYDQLAAAFIRAQEAQRQQVAAAEQDKNDNDEQDESPLAQ